MPAFEDIREEIDPPFQFLPSPFVRWCEYVVPVKSDVTLTSPTRRTRLVEVVTDLITTRFPLLSAPHFYSGEINTIAIPRENVSMFPQPPIDEILPLTLGEIDDPTINDRTINPTPIGELNFGKGLVIKVLQVEDDDLAPNVPAAWCMPVHIGPVELVATGQIDRGPYFDYRDLRALRGEVVDGFICTTENIELHGPVSCGGTKLWNTGLVTVAGLYATPHSTIISVRDLAKEFRRQCAQLARVDPTTNRSLVEFSRLLRAQMAHDERGFASLQVEL